MNADIGPAIDGDDAVTVVLPPDLEQIEHAPTSGTARAASPFQDRIAVAIAGLKIEPLMMIGPCAVLASTNEILRLGKLTPYTSGVHAFR